MTLRVLGRAAICDDVAEMGRGAKSTISALVKKFCLNFNTSFYDEFIYFPTGQQLMAGMAIYASMGHPGAVASMDAKQWQLERCPSNLRQECTGKEGVPTLGFNLISNHGRRIYHVSKYFHGNVNDITKTRVDPVTAQIMNGLLGSINFFFICRVGKWH